MLKGRTAGDFQLLLGEELVQEMAAPCLGNARNRRFKTFGKMAYERCSRVRQLRKVREEGRDTHQHHLGIGLIKVHRRALLMNSLVQHVLKSRPILFNDLVLCRRTSGHHPLYNFSTRDLRLSGDVKPQALERFSAGQ
jgi:hypothetical protein